MERALVRVAASLLLGVSMAPAWAAHFSVHSIDAKALDNRIAALDPNVLHKLRTALTGADLPASTTIRLTISHGGKVSAVEVVNEPADKLTREKARKALSGLSFGLLPSNARSGTTNLVFAIGDVLSSQTNISEVNQGALPANTAGGDGTSTVVGHPDPLVRDPKLSGSDASFAEEMSNLYNDYYYMQFPAENGRVIFSDVFYHRNGKDSMPSAEEYIRQGETFAKSNHTNPAIMCFINATIEPMKKGDLDAARPLIERAVTMALKGNDQNRLFTRKALLAYVNSTLYSQNEKILEGADFILGKIKTIPLDKSEDPVKSQLELMQIQKKVYQRQMRTSETIELNKQIASQCLLMKPPDFKTAMEAYRDIETVAQQLTTTDELREASQKSLNLIEEQMGGGLMELQELGHLIAIAESNHHTEESEFFRNRLREIVDNYVPQVRTTNGARDHEAVRDADSMLNAIVRLNGGRRSFNPMFGESFPSAHAEALDDVERQCYKLKVKAQGFEFGALSTFCNFLQSEGRDDEAADLLADACRYIETSSDTRIKNQLMNARNSLVNVLTRAGRVAEANTVKEEIAKIHNQEVAESINRQESSIRDLEAQASPDYAQLVEARLRLALSYVRERNGAGLRLLLVKAIADLERINGTRDGSVAARHSSGMTSQIGYHLNSLLQELSRKSATIPPSEYDDVLVKIFRTADRQLSGGLDPQRMSLSAWTSNGKLERAVMNGLIKERQEREGIHAASLRPIYESMARNEQRRREYNFYLEHEREILAIDQAHSAERYEILQDQLSVAKACLFMNQVSEATKLFETVRKALGTEKVDLPPKSTMSTLLGDLSQELAMAKQLPQADAAVRLALSLMNSARHGTEFYAINQATIQLVADYSNAHEQKKAADLLNSVVESLDRIEGKDNLNVLQYRHYLSDLYLTQAKDATEKDKDVLLSKSEDEFNKLIEILKSSSTVNATTRTQQINTYTTLRIDSLRGNGFVDQATFLEAKSQISPNPSRRAPMPLF